MDIHCFTKSLGNFASALNTPETPPRLLYMMNNYRTVANDAFGRLISTTLCTYLILQFSSLHLNVCSQ
jgi:hypothetical protein